ncbi:MAG: DUF4177 domain-containing protein [Candidatus Latescibacteria bacterium]|nr:DUF4177 domain-containing protein [Candidatus Latescibacterota bacterium]
MKADTITRTGLVVVGLLLLLNLISLWTTASRASATPPVPVQYKVVPKVELGAPARDLQDILDQYGQDGWELVWMTDKALVKGYLKEALIFKKGGFPASQE